MPDRKILYRSASTGLLVRDTTNIPDVKSELRYSGVGTSHLDPEEITLFNANNASPFGWAVPIIGEDRNRMDGGPFVEHGLLDGRGAYAGSAITATDANFTPVAHRDAKGNVKFATDEWWVIMDRRPKRHEIGEIFTNTELNAEVIQLGTYVADTSPIDLNGATAFAGNHPKWSYLHPIVGVPASYNLDTGAFGAKYIREQPSAPSTVTGVDGTSQTINVSFSQVTDSLVQGYMVSILKKGDALSLYGPPVFVPEYVFESEYDDTGQVMAVYALSSSELVLATSTYTVSGLNRYFKTSNKTSTAIVAGTYYAVVRSLTSTTFNDALRWSDAAISAAITVA